MIDRAYMQLALELATRAEPAPNPRVGAVIVRESQLVGSGYHERAGGPHAEIVALARAGAAASGATLFVTLEPCNHFGRTPPCVDAILRSGIARVVIGCGDPNHGVAGGGANRLRAAGIDVAENVLAEQARELIAPWIESLTRPARPASPKISWFSSSTRNGRRLALGLAR